VKCEAAAAILASEGPAPISVGRQHARSSCDFAQHVSRVTVVVTCDNMEELVYLHEVWAQVREWEAVKKMRLE